MSDKTYPPPKSITIEYADGQTVTHSITSAAERLMKHNLTTSITFMYCLAVLTVGSANESMTYEGSKRATKRMLDDAYGSDEGEECEEEGDSPF